MAKQVQLDCQVVIDGYDFGNLARNVQIDADADLIEVSGHGDAARTQIKGFRSWSLTVSGMNDYASGQLAEKLDTWWRATTPVTMAVKLKQADPISSSNPEFQGNVWIRGPVPLLQANWGQPGEYNTTFQGDGDLTRDVTP